MPARKSRPETKIIKDEAPDISFGIFWLFWRKPMVHESLTNNKADILPLL